MSRFMAQQTSAGIGPENLEISGTAVSIQPFLFPTVPTVFSTWTTRRCLSSEGMILPSWKTVG